jgi:hypothetical protein
MLLYPQSLPRPVDSRIPEVVSSDLKEALLCFSVEAHRAAAVLARRAIQVICLDKGAPKDQKLNQQIDWLFDNGVITKDLKEWAHEVRFIGNDGAHPGNLSDEAVTKNDSEDILNLVEQFAKVLYVAPAIASERKKHRESK